MKLSKIYYLVLPALAVLGMVSCKKQNSMGFTPGTGTPSITSVSTLSRTVNDTVTTTVTTYDNTGAVTTKENVNPTHQTTIPLDSTTATGKKQNYYVIHGTNLGSATNVTFNGITAYFNRALITDNTIIVSIPLAVPTTGASATNKLVVTTTHGSANFSFTVLTPPPTIASASDYDFWKDSEITLTGVGFASVTSVTLTGSTTPITIVSQTDDQIVLKFPEMAINYGSLVFSYSSAGKAVTATSKEVFNDLDNGYAIFYKDNFQNAWGDNSWQGPSGLSTAASHSGSASIVATYPSNGWKIEGWANWYPSFAYDASYKYLTFWVKGGSEDHVLTLVGDKAPGGYSQNQSPAAAQKIPVPANVWTFYKIPLGPAANQFDFWNAGSPAQNLGFFLLGQSTDADQTMYFDEVAFLK